MLNIYERWEEDDFSILQRLRNLRARQTLQKEVDLNVMILRYDLHYEVFALGCCMIQRGLSFLQFFRFLSVVVDEFDETMKPKTEKKKSPIIIMNNKNNNKKKNKKKFIFIVKEKKRFTTLKTSA